MIEQISFYQQKLAYELDSWDLNEAIKNCENIVVVDARSKESYDHEHIVGAINLPHRTISRETTANLDKHSLYVFYCSGIGCNASTKGAMNLALLGFSVKELIGGLEWWKRESYGTISTKLELASA